jgi:hypothetical protein
MKFIRFLVEALFWILLFFCPVFASVFMGLGIASVTGDLKQAVLIALPFGAVGGVILAEYIRRKYGCSNFYGRLARMPELEKPGSRDKQKPEKK